MIDGSSLPERFSSKVKFTDTCWLWEAYTNADGYGKYMYKTKVVWSAHRFCWYHFNGEIPKGLSVLHKCDVRNCVNPEHLFLGTQNDNVQDMINKGRYTPLRGESHGSSRLTKDDVEKIRKLSGSGIKGSDIAKKFGVSRDHIYHIIHNRLWKI